MKRLISIILVFVILFTSHSAAFLVNAAGTTSNNYTFTSIDEKTVYIRPHESEVTVLIFGVCYSTNTKKLLNEVANSNWVNCDNIRTIFVDCSDTYRCSKSDIQNFANTIDKSDITYCYDSNGGNQSYSAVSHYFGSTITPPMVVLLDYQNSIQYTSQNVSSQQVIINKILEFADVDYENSTANIKISGQEDYDYAFEVLEHINAKRQAKGLSKLTMDSIMIEGAMQRAAEAYIYMNPTRPNGEKYHTVCNWKGSIYGGLGYPGNNTTNELAASWTNNYSDLLSSQYTSIGIGCFIDEKGFVSCSFLLNDQVATTVSKTGKKAVIKTINITKSKILLESDLSKTSINATGSDKSQMDVYLYHTDAQYDEFAKLHPSSLNYTSSNPSVASVDENGIITGHLNGTATITAALKDDNSISVSKTITTTGGVEENIQYGLDRFSFGQDITGYVGDTLNTLLVYTSSTENIASLNITSSDSNVVEIGTVNTGVGEYITGENEHMATIPLKFKKEGTVVIKIKTPNGTSKSITVTSKKVSYEIKMYCEIPTVVVGVDRTIGAVLQLEKNGMFVEEVCQYSFVSSNTEIATVSNIRYEKDGVYFYINGHKSGVAKLTVTESNTGAIYSTLIQVNDGIITYNAEALPTYYDRDAQCNGFVNGMYMDEFQSKKKNDKTLSVSFNVYNTTSLVGVVDVYDRNNKLVSTYPIKRYDGGIVSSLYETIKEGYYLIKDVVTGDILTYKQSSYSQKTEIKDIDVPIGGHIEITNDINHSDSCCVLNVTELSITTILTVGDTIKGLSSSEIKKVAEESSLTIFKNEIGSKLPEIASDFREKIIKSIAKDAGDVIVADALNIASENALNVFESFDIDFTKLVVDSAASLGVGIAEDAFVAATAFIGATLKGMFIVADYLELSCFIMQIAIPRSDKAMSIYFDDENGCLVNNGVSIKAQGGTTNLSDSNFVMHSIVLSNEEDLTSEIKQSLDDISNDYVVRNIYLERDGVVSQPGQTVQVYMPIPDNYDPNKCKLYWVKDDGTLEQKDFTVVGDNIMFTTDHFSYWALVIDDNNEISYTVEADKNIAHPGDTITYAVYLQQTSTQNSLEFTIKVPEGLSYVANSAAIPSGINSILNWTGDGEGVSWTEQSMIYNGFGSKSFTGTEKVKLLTFKCVVDDNAAYKDYNVELIDLVADDSYYKTKNPIASPATVTVTKETATPSSVTVVSNPSKTTYYIGDTLNTSGLNLKLTYSDGSTKTITSGFTTSGFSSTSAGTKTVTVTYEGKTTTFNVTVKTPSITLSPTSKTMIVGDSSNITATTTPSGQTITWTSSNTSVATVSNGTITAKGTGTATITAKFIYNGTTYSKTCSVVVNNRAIVLESMSIVSNPTKTTYYIGDSLNTSGLKLLATYSDDSTETITSGFSVSGFSSTTAGTKTVTVSYEGFIDTFTVTVKTPSITLSSSSKNMSVGDSSTITATTTPSGQTVTWTSSNTSVATVSGGTITAKASGSATITAKFTYNGITYSNICSIVVNEGIVLESISIISNPSKTTYYIGDALNTDGLKLLATYSEGSTETITSGFTTSGFSSTTAGTKTVTVSYAGFTDTFTVTVKKPSLTLSRNDVSLKNGNTVTLSAVTDPNNEDVNWTSSDTSIATVSNGVITAKKAGTTTITAKFTYNGIAYSDVCTVTCIVPVGLEIDKLPDKIVFYVGDCFDRRGLKTKMLYSDGSYESDWGVTSTSLDQVSVFLSEGTRTVIVYNGSYSTSYTIEVKPLVANLLTNELSLNVGNTHQIEFETSPGDMSQLVSAKWTSSNRNVATVDENGVVKAVGVGTAEITLKIVNGGCSTTSNTCMITVDNPIESISIKSNPAKTDYYIGDLMDDSGLELLVTYEDGSTETVTNGFITSGFSSTSAGTKTVTVSYEGFTDTFTVTIKTPSIVLSSNSMSMEVDGSSTITATTTPSGQNVTWVSSNTSVATVSNGTITAKASGSTTITAKFTYNGNTYSKTCTVIVAEEPVPTSITVSSKPTKTTYEIGQSLNTSGLKLKLTYSDGSTETITSGFTTSGFSFTTTGTKTVTVKYNGLTTTFTVTVAHTHDYTSSVTEKPTCTSTGIRTYTCFSCGDSYTETISATGHNWDSATCDEPKTCTKCGITSGDALGHEYNARTTKNPTCTENGIKTHTCIECGHVYTKSIPALGHDYDSGKVTKKTTCKAAGVKTYTCEDCGATKTSTIAKLTTHTYSNNCDKSCNVCGKTRTVGAHKYSNACDTTCNYCNAKRTIKHTYSNACDTSCNVCKATRTITHTYKTTTTKATLSKNGSIVKKCTVCGKVASNTAIKYAKTFKLSTTTYTYNGGVKTPTVTVKDSAGKTLKKNTDYTVTYASGRKNAGTYKVTVKMIGKYSGTKTLTFKINPAKISSYKLSATSYTYDGKVKKPTVTVKNSSGTKLTTSSYTVTYASGRKNVGTYKVTIKGKGNYTGTKTLTFKINPAKTTVSKLTAGKKSITVAITKKSTQVTGYQIQYSTSKTFSKATTKTISSYKTTKYTLKSLSAKKTYYVRVRTYKKVGSTTYYSGWSTYKYVKTK